LARRRRRAADAEDVVAAAAAAAAAADAAALVLQQPLGDGPAAVQRADQVLLRHLHVGEEGLAERRGAGDQPDRPHLDARIVHVDQQEADALVLLAGVGAHQAEAHVGPLAAGGPDLLAVDQEVVALVLGLGLQRGEVGAGARLGEALAPAHFLPGDGADVLLLLLLVAVLEQGRAEHHRAHAADRVPGADAVHLLLQHARLGRREAAAAVGLGQVGTPQPLSPMALVQALMSASSGFASSMYIMPPLPFSEAGKFASSQALASARKASISRRRNQPFEFNLLRSCWDPAE
jgi:hypothetical protein